MSNSSYTVNDSPPMALPAGTDSPGSAPGDGDAVDDSGAAIVEVTIIAGSTAARDPRRDPRLTGPLLSSGQLPEVISASDVSASPASPYLASSVLHEVLTPCATCC
jgi:hypothetical protein